MLEETYAGVVDRDRVCRSLRTSKVGAADLVMNATQRALQVQQVVLGP